jgi:hypothetical protein
MLSDTEIMSLFQKGASKVNISKMLVTQAKADKKRLSAWDALKIVENAILEDYRKIQGGVKAPERFVIAYC